MCVQAMNGRWYGGRRLEVVHWDGVTNYQVEETEKEREERLKQWENFLEDEEGGGGGGTGREKVAETPAQETLRKVKMVWGRFMSTSCLTTDVMSSHCAWNISAFFTKLLL